MEELVTHEFVVNPAWRNGEQIWVSLDFYGENLVALDLGIRAGRDEYKYRPTKGDFQHTLKVVRDSLDNDGNLTLTNSSTLQEFKVKGEKITELLRENISVLQLSS